MEKNFIPKLWKKAMENKIKELELTQQYLNGEITLDEMTNIVIPLSPC